MYITVHSTMIIQILAIFLELEFNVAVWRISMKPPNFILPSTQCLYMKQWLIFRLPPNYSAKFIYYMVVL